MIGTQVVSFMKARKIAQDELNKSLAEQATQLATDEQALRKLEDAIKSGAKYEDVFDDAMQGASKSAKEHAIATKGAAGSTDVFVEKQKQAQTQLQATTKASKAAKIGMQALATVGNMFLGMAISWGVSKLVEGIDNLIHAEEKAAEKLEEMIQLGEEAKNAIDDINSKLESNKKTIENVTKTYEELISGIDTLTNANLSLSTEDYERFLETNNQMAELFPELIRGYDDSGNAILNIGSTASEVTEKIDALTIKYYLLKMAIKFIF